MMAKQATIPLGDMKKNLKITIPTRLYLYIRYLARKYDKTEEEIAVKLLNRFSQKNNQPRNKRSN